MRAIHIKRFIDAVIGYVIKVFIYFNTDKITPKLTAATPVPPTPMNGSRTVAYDVIRAIRNNTIYAFGLYCF